MVKERRRERVQQNLRQHEKDTRFQHELKEMQETQDLREIDDDVEDVATLYEWQAVEHHHQPKSPAWFMVVAGVSTVLVAIFLFSFNFIGAIAVACFGAMFYFLAQRKPSMMRYRIMVDGIALNNTLYHYKELHAFNIVYEPGETKTAIFRGKGRFVPLIHMELGNADPIAIRDILLEFLQEDQDLEEPLIDILARRLGF